MEILTRMVTLFLSMPRSVKRVVMIAVDILALVLALWSAFALRLSDWWPTESLLNAVPLFVATPILGVAIFVKLGMYRAVLRYMNVKLMQAVAVGVLSLVALMYLFVYIATPSGTPRSIPLIFGLAAWLYLGGSRLILRGYYHWAFSNAAKENNSLIYGAGNAGAQLATALQSSGEVRPVAFIDDDKKLVGNMLCGLPVYASSQIADLVKSRKIRSVLLAMFDVTPERRSEILDQLSQYSVEVKTMPTLREQLEGRSVDELRSIEIEDLLGRDTVVPSIALLDRSIKNKSVLVTGAGGSIGSELARQALLFGAKTVVLFEQCEYSLYTINAELLSTARKKGIDCEILPVLGSVQDRERVILALQKYQVCTLYHAAAYKHVPMVEHNVLQGIANNTLGTEIVAQAAEKANIERFVLISTDKAVRPTNVMGATKRCAEIVVQQIAEHTNSRTIFSMVRFGNVLGSSGSVVPLFRTQIERGGPVTVTHPQINRFFMTIPEAATLVIQAGSLATGGDVFLLDMGEPIKIADLAKQMIRLSGRTVRDESHPSGDIAIEYTGLRPGEKLYEELLIGADPEGTEHVKIMKANERFPDKSVVDETIVLLRQAVASNDSVLGREALRTVVVDYLPAADNVDLLSNAAASRVANKPNILRVS